jgi:hypothetical protein
MGATELVGGTQQVRQSSGNLQRVFAGLPSTSVGATSTGSANVVVSEPFRPDRLILGLAAQATGAFVTNIQIGTKSLNVSTNAVPGNCFAENAIGSHLEGYTAQPGVGFVVGLSNTTGATIVFTGGVFGPALN